MIVLRNAFAVLAGVLVTGLVVALVEMIGLRLFPAAGDMSGMDPANLEAMRAFVAAQPLGAHVFVVAAWTLGAFAGALVAVELARSHHALLAWFVAGITLAMVGITVWKIPHPAWMVVGGVVLPLIAAGIAVRWRAPRRVTTAA